MPWHDFDVEYVRAVRAEADDLVDVRRVRVEWLRHAGQTLGVLRPAALDDEGAERIGEEAAAAQDAQEDTPAPEAE